MKFSENWLREFVNPAISREELITQLTMAGLEIDGFENVANDFNHVVVGEVLSVEKHPDADKLSVCRVRVNDGEALQIVCGATNVRAGLKAPVALVGAQLAKDFKIKKSKLRGVESNGMLCAEDELGLAESSNGLMELPEDAPVGQCIREYLALNDAMIEVDLTPNRGDCLSIQGLARDLAALNQMQIKVPAITQVAKVVNDGFDVKLSAAEACRRYVGRIIRNINLNAKTPLWMKEKLRRGGIRSINAVVDVTNFVLLELGQPMHAFDFKKLQGGIDVRMAKSGEKLTLLDGQELELRDDTLVIADQQKALALAGIMGGRDSCVTENTQDIFLESAFFSPLSLAGKARSYGLHTDSSHRFERGVDYALQEKALERATQLLLDIAGGEAGHVIHVCSEHHLPQQQCISLRKARLEHMLGLMIPETEVEQIFFSLGLSVKDCGNAWQVEIPSYRFDLNLEIDLIEEVARIYGYNRLPSAPLNFSQSLAAKTEQTLSKSVLIHALKNLSYRESICYSFIDERIQKLFAPDAELIRLANPLSSELETMRTSLWPGLVKAALFNQNRQQAGIRLFEHGLVFNKEGETILQTPRLAALMSASALPECWDGSGRKLDFFDMKADLEALLAMGGSNITFQAKAHTALHPGQSAEILKNGQHLGYIGALHPKISQALELQEEIYLFELDLNLLSQKSLPQFESLSRFPEMSRDLAFIVDQQLPVQALIDTARQLKSGILREISIFDLYEGENIGLGKKSVALNFRFQHADRTLEELEVTDFVDKMIKKLEQSFNAKLRD